MSGQISWPGAGAAAGSSHELHFSPPGRVAVLRLRTMPALKRMGSPAQICRRIARQKMYFVTGLPAVACGLGSRWEGRPAG